MTKCRIFILGLKTGADTRKLRGYLSGRLGITDEFQPDRIIHDIPGLVYEAAGPEEARRLKSELELLGAAVEVESPFSRRAPRSGAIKRKATASGFVSSKPLIYFALAAVAAAFGLVLLARHMAGPDRSPPPSSIGSRSESRNQPPESPATHSFAASEIPLGQPGEPVAEDERYAAIPAQAASAMNEGRYEEAWSILRERLESDPRDKEAAEAFRFAAFKIAGERYEKGEYSEAAGYLGPVADYFPDDAELNASLGAVYYAAKEYSRSRRCLDKALRLGIKDPDVHLLMARMYYYQDDDMDMAGRHLRKALELKPDREDLRKFLQKITTEEAVEEDFRAADTEHFIVKYQGVEDSDAAYTTLYILEQAWSDIGYDLGDYPSEPVVVILYTGKQFKQVTESPHWVGGIYDGRIRLPVAGLPDRGDDDLRRLLYHEYTHVIVHRIAGGRCPVWFNEGLAQLMQERSGASRDPWLKTSLLQSGGIPSLKALSEPFLKLSSGQALKAYTISYFATKYFVDEYGLSAAGNVLESLGDGKDFDAALYEVTGTRPEDFERRFHRWLAEYRD